MVIVAVLVALIAVIMMVQAGTPVPGPSGGSSPGGSYPGGGVIMTEVEKLIGYARSCVGKAYSQAPGKRTGPDSYDCSGLVVWAHSQLGITTPQLVTEQAEQAPWKEDAKKYATHEAYKASLKPGYCLGRGYADDGRYKHTGIWTGNSVIHAAGTARGVVEDIGLKDIWFNERRKTYAYIGR